VSEEEWGLVEWRGESPTCEVTIACLVTGYFPEPVNVKWNSGSVTKGIKTFPAMAQSSGKAFTLVSQLTIPAWDLAHNTYQCSVEHTPSRKKIEVEITNGELHWDARE
uniref:Ig-like domain-containing protein n=1 Tax=Terrapene triunguis TaxID=2587831 RepID=A0A674IAH7_9SAUR